MTLRPALLAPALLAAAILTPAPAPAQDPAADYLAVAGDFLIGETALDPEAAARTMFEEIGALEGLWAAAHILFPDPGDFDPELLAEACALRPLRLERTSPLGFAVSTLRDGQAVLTVRYQFLGFRSFQRSVDEAELRAYMGVPEDDLLRLPLANPAWTGPVELFRPSPDLLALQGTAAPPELWARCP